MVQDALLQCIQSERVKHNRSDPFWFHLLETANLADFKNKRPRRDTDDFRDVHVAMRINPRHEAVPYKLGKTGICVYPFPVPSLEAYDHRNFNTRNIQMIEDSTAEYLKESVPQQNLQRLIAVLDQNKHGRVSSGNPQLQTPPDKVVQSSQRTTTISVVQHRSANKTGHQSSRDGFDTLNNLPRPLSRLSNQDSYESIKYPAGSSGLRVS